MPVVVDNGKIKVATGLVDVSGTDGTVLYTAMPPEMKYVIKKLLIYNQDTADHEVTLGEYDTTSSTWNEDKLIVKVAAGAMVELTEDDLPADFVMTVDPETAILAWAAKLDAAVTANPVKVKAEFEVS